MSRVQFKTNHGDFIIELNEELAPITALFFIALSATSWFKAAAWKLA